MFKKTADSQPDTRSEQEKLIDELAKLRKSVQTSNTQNRLWYMFLRSAVAALGATVGLTLIFTLLLWLGHSFSFIPGVTAITNTVQQFDRTHATK